MKVGDFVRFATGRGRETDVGLLVSIEDNPADSQGTYPIDPPRKIGRILSDGALQTAWLAHIKPAQPEGRHNESR